MALVENQHGGIELLATIKRRVVGWSVPENLAPVEPQPVDPPVDPVDQPKE